jgi:ABC-type arginine transport system ATPase subunit
MDGLIAVKGVPRSEATGVREELLAKVGLADTRDVYPNRLSGGRQHRVAIARALALTPQVAEQGTEEVPRRHVHPVTAQTTRLPARVALSAVPSLNQGVGAA